MAALAACLSDSMSLQRDGSLAVRRTQAMSTDGWQFSGATSGGPRRVAHVRLCQPSSSRKLNAAADRWSRIRWTARRRKMTVDVDDGKKAEELPRFLEQLRAILNVLPAYTWYAPPSGSLAFVSKRQADFLGVPKDHPLRFGIDIGAPWDAHIPFLHPDDQKQDANTGQTVCARARAMRIIIESVTLKETIAGSLAPNRSGQAMEPYCFGLGRLWILKSSCAPRRRWAKANEVHVRHLTG